MSFSDKEYSRLEKKAYQQLTGLLLTFDEEVDPCKPKKLEDTVLALENIRQLASDSNQLISQLLLSLLALEDGKAQRKTLEDYASTELSLLLSPKRLFESSRDGLLFLFRSFVEPFPGTIHKNRHFRRNGITISQLKTYMFGATTAESVDSDRLEIQRMLTDAPHGRDAYDFYADLGDIIRVVAELLAQATHRASATQQVPPAGSITRSDENQVVVIVKDLPDRDKRFRPGRSAVNSDQPDAARAEDSK